MKKSTKGIFILATLLFSIVFCLQFASAWTYHDPWKEGWFGDGSDYYNGPRGADNNQYYNSYSDTWEVTHKIVSETNTPWGYSKHTETYSDKVTDETKNYLNFERQGHLSYNPYYSSPQGYNEGDYGSQYHGYLKPYNWN